MSKNGVHNLDDWRHDKRILDLFAGSETASGTHGAPTLDDNGIKWGIKSTAKTLKKPVTPVLWGEHLEGKRPLGVIPIRADGKCKWGSIDIDDYDVDVVEIINKVNAYKLPLAPCWSKSGGLHLFMFMAEWTDAKIVQDTLRDMAALLGFGDSEIFPKQIGIGEDGFGNWMTMPYLGTDFDGKIKYQYGLKKTGAEMTLGEFLDAADGLLQTVSSLEQLKIKRAGKPNGKDKTNRQGFIDAPPPDAPFGDGPPCLQVLMATPLTDGRKRTLFQTGIYLKKAHPTKWEAMLDDYNQKHMSPPLPPDEVEGACKSLRKKDYQYMCKHEPMQSNCNSLLCCARRFGVGDGETIPVIVKWRKVMFDDPVYYITIKGNEETEMEIPRYREIHWHHLFIEHCGGQLGMVFSPIKQTLWSMMMKEYIKLEEPEQPPEDINVAGQFREQMKQFLTNRSRGEDSEDLFRDGIMTWEDEKKKRYYFRIEVLETFLSEPARSRTIRELKRKNLLDLIKGLKGGYKPSLYTKIGNLRVWWVPSDAVEKAPTLPPPKDRKDHL